MTLAYTRRSIKCLTGTLFTLAFFFLMKLKIAHISRFPKGYLILKELSQMPTKLNLWLHFIRMNLSFVEDPVMDQRDSNYLHKLFNDGLMGTHIHTLQ